MAGMVEANGSGRCECAQTLKVGGGGGGNGGGDGGAGGGEDDGEG